MYRPLPRHRARDDRARRSPPRGLERGPPSRRQGWRTLVERRALGALEEPREPDRPQSAKLARIKQQNEPLYTAYLLKEQLRATLREPNPDTARRQLELWISWAQESGLTPFARCAQTIADHHERIIATIRHRLTNARVEALNTTLRLLIRRAYGFHSANAMIALAVLKLGGYRPQLPNTA